METRILHICPRSSYSGLETWVQTQIEDQASKKIPVAVLALGGSPLAEGCSRISECQIFPVKVEKNIFSLWKAFYFALRDFKPNIIHLHGSQEFTPLLPFLFWLKLRSNKIKIVLQIHIWWSHSKKDIFHALSYLAVDEFWCSSQKAKDSLIEILPVPPLKIRILRYGRDVASISQGLMDRATARSSLGLRAKSVVFGNVSRIDRGKGAQEFVDGLLPLLEENPDMEILWIGPPTDDQKEKHFALQLLKKIDELNRKIGHRIHFVGSRPQSFQFLKAIDIFCLPTYRECFALTLLEAGLAAVPILATNSGGTPEIVREGITGWLFEPQSAEALTDAAKKVLSNPTTWSVLGKNARELVVTEYSMQAQLDQLTQTYAELLQ